MARYTGNRTASLKFRFEPELRAQLEDRALREDRSMADVVRQLIKLGLTASAPLTNRSDETGSADDSTATV